MNKPNQDELSKIRPREIFRRKAVLLKDGKPIPMTGEYKGRHVMLDFSELKPGHRVVFIEKEYNNCNRTVYDIKSKPFINESKQYTVSVENTGNKISEKMLKELTEERCKYEFKIIPSTTSV